MSVKVSLSIILCTRNRATELQRALKALGEVKIPANSEAELVVVDNGSTDKTVGIIENCVLRNMQVRYLLERKEGKCYALNAGIANAVGDILLFIDDDVTPEEDWAKELMFALLNGTCDAVTGQITLAPRLVDGSLTPMQRWWLGSSDDAKPHGGIRELIGANMGFRRSVLQRVPAFDTELGPGALGFADDTLFGWQLSKAEFRIGYAPSSGVIHHVNPSRLRRTKWLSAARKRGRSEAYLRYHWEHSDIEFARLRQLYYYVKLQLRRVVQRPQLLESEGCPLWEMSYVLNMAMCKQFCLERSRPRNYTRCGLARRMPQNTPPRKLLGCGAAVETAEPGT